MKTKLTFIKNKNLFSKMLSPKMLEMKNHKSEYLKYNKTKVYGFCFLLIFGVGYCTNVGYSKNIKVNTKKFYGNYKGHKIGEKKYKKI
jgi:hypothetical protein